MLIEFSVENFRSFGREVTLSMASTELTSREAPQIDIDNRMALDEKPAMLRSAVVYGANASGKSNLVRALRFMRTFVINSAREGQRGDAIPVEPFRLDVDLRDEPSCFEAVFRAGGRRYRYGFEVDAQRVHREWLYYVRKREALLFERDGDAFKVMPEMKAAIELQGMTRPNALFLSVAAQFNNARAIEVLDWYRSIGFLGGVHDESAGWTATIMAQDPELRAAVVRFLQRLDLGITDLDASIRPLERYELPPDMPADLVDRMLELEGLEQIEVVTRHEVFDEAGALVGIEEFDLYKQESGGTCKLFAMAGPVLRALKRGTLLVIDELDARLHTVLSQGILELFHGAQNNPNGAQLVAMTHDTNLLDRKLLRRDQIWFVEKDRRGQSDLYSLASLKERNDAAFEQHYRQGRYGAIPLPGPLSSLLTEAPG